MIASLVLSLAVATGCPFNAPIEGSIERQFAPQGRYAGHWGIDIGAPVGSAVRAIAAGTVTFSGEVAGRSSITIDHGGGLRSSYSYLSRRRVTTGVKVSSGTVIAASGIDNEIEALHLSLRLGAIYIDPQRACGLLRPADGLSLAS